MSGTTLTLDLDALRFDGRGLVAAIAQDAFTGRVLMVAWANREAVERTMETGEAHFFSRSRGELWRKGETSGNVLEVVGLAADCDGDALLLSVDPSGPACHTGATSCFAQAPGGLDLGALERIVAARAGADPESSYTARLLREGAPRIAQKVGEEATEVVVAALTGDGGGDGDATDARARLVEETSDLLFHLVVLLRARGVGVEEVAAELAKRHREAARQPGAQAPPASGSGGGPAGPVAAGDPTAVLGRQPRREDPRPGLAALLAGALPSAPPAGTDESRPAGSALEEIPTSHGQAPQTPSPSPSPAPAPPRKVTPDPEETP